MLNGQLTIQNCGDSVAIAVKANNSWTKLNEEHLPLRPDEKQRIINNNGFIIKNRVQGDLQVSRAFGNLEHKHLIISEPEGKSFALSPEDDLLILSTDGLFHSYSYEHVVKRVTHLRDQGFGLGYIAQTVVEECLRQEGGCKPCKDNVTLMIVSLKDYYREWHNRSLNDTPQQLSLRKMLSEGSPGRINDFSSLRFSDVNSSDYNGGNSSPASQSYKSSTSAFFGNGGPLP